MALALVSGTASAMRVRGDADAERARRVSVDAGSRGAGERDVPVGSGRDAVRDGVRERDGDGVRDRRVETATRWSAGKAAADAAATLAALGLGRGDAAKMRWIGVGTFAVSVGQAGLGWWLVSTTTPRGWDEPLAPRATTAGRSARDGDVWIFCANGASVVARSILLQSSFFRRGGGRGEELGAERVGGAPRRRVAVDGVLVRRRRVRDVRDGDRVALVRRRSEG